MPQHDLILDNGSGAAFRADANNALAALGSTMKGPNAPPAPIAGMMWLDDDTPSASLWTLKQYDGADWIEIGRLNVTTNVFTVAEGSFAPVDIASAATTDIGAAASPNVRITGTTGITSFGTVAAGTRRFLAFAAALTLTHNATSLILPGAANITTAAGDTAVARSLGSGNWVIESFTRAAGLPVAQMATARVLGRLAAGSGAIEEIPLGNAAAALSLGINRGTEQATSAGTQVQYDYGSIPAGVRRVKLLLKQVSTNGTSHLAVRLGTSGGIVSSGYDCMFAYDAPGVGGVTSVGSGAFGISNGSSVDTHTGIMTFENQSGNLWLCSYIGMLAVSVDRYRTHCSGFVDLGGGLTQLRLTTNSGTPVFDSGAIQLMWEF